MLGSGRTVGLIVILGGIGLACVGSLVSVLAVTTIANIAMGWVLLGILFSFIVPSPLIGFGIRRFRRGQQTLQELATIKKQKMLLLVVKDRGVIALGDLASALNTDIEEVKHLIFDLVGKGLFHGYINWDDGMLFSKHAVVLQGTTHCPYCGGEQRFVGRGIIPCQYCNTQVLL